MPPKKTWIQGLHDFLMETVIQRYAVPGNRAVDLGVGTGTLAGRMQKLGLEVTGVDLNPNRLKTDIPVVQLDLNTPHFSSQLGENNFDLVTAVEVIEHLESPISFLRNIQRLLNSKGIALVTTPNLDNVPTRSKFLLTGELHMMDKKAQDHISPIFFDLFIRQYLPRADLKLIEHDIYPRYSYKVGTTLTAGACRFLARFLPGHTLGDFHIFVLQSRDDQ